MASSESGTPGTEAGRTLLRVAPPGYDFRADILAIEAQATLSERARVREAVEAAAPVHIGQMFTATDRGETDYRPDDCLYRGDLLAIIDGAS